MKGGKKVGLHPSSPFLSPPGSLLETSLNVFCGVAG